MNEKEKQIAESLLGDISNKEYSIEKKSTAVRTYAEFVSAVRSRVGMESQIRKEALYEAERAKNERAMNGQEGTPQES